MKSCISSLKKHIGRGALMPALLITALLSLGAGTTARVEQADPRRHRHKGHASVGHGRQSVPETQRAPDTVLAVGAGDGEQRSDQPDEGAQKHHEHGEKGESRPVGGSSPAAGDVDLHAPDVTDQAPRTGIRARTQITAGGTHATPYVPIVYVDLPT